MQLKGKVALITGGGTGIGAEIAKRFAAEGATVCICGRREQCLDQVIDALPPGTAVKCVGDVTKPADIERIVAKTLGLNNRIHVLVNCAGASSLGSVTTSNLEEWRKTMEINLVGPFLLMRAVIPLMVREGGGSIINVSSLAGIRCLSEASAYCASKAGLIMLTQQAALDYGQHNIRCNAICPGFVYTDMTKGGFGKLAAGFGVKMETLVETLLKDVPMPNPVGPDKIAGVCSFLASDDSSYITGAVIPVDGGSSIVDVFGAGVRKISGHY